MEPTSLLASYKIVDEMNRLIRPDVVSPRDGIPTTSETKGREDPGQRCREATAALVGLLAGMVAAAVSGGALLNTLAPFGALLTAMPDTVTGPEPARRLPGPAKRVGRGHREEVVSAATPSSVFRVARRKIVR
jgi:hypothetical protein